MDNETRGIVGNVADQASIRGRKAMDTASETVGVVAQNATNSAIAAGEAISVAAGVAGRTLSAAAAQVSSAASSAASGVSVAAVKAAELSSAIAVRASEVAWSGAILVGDLNGDGKLDAADVKIARAATAQAAIVVGAEAADLGKSVIRSDMVKQAAAGAALGAVIAIPLPVIGPAIGASIGAIIGMWRSATKPEIVIQQPTGQAGLPKDALAEIEKLHDLKEKGIITEVDFERQKQKLLR